MDLKEEAMTNGGSDNVNDNIGLRKPYDLIALTDRCFRDMNMGNMNENGKGIKKQGFIGYNTFNSLMEQQTCEKRGALCPLTDQKLLGEVYKET